MKALATWGAQRVALLWLAWPLAVALLALGALLALVPDPAPYPPPSALPGAPAPVAAADSAAPLRGYAVPVLLSPPVAAALAALAVLAGPPLLATAAWLRARRRRPPGGHLDPPT